MHTFKSYSHKLPIFTSMNRIDELFARKKHGVLNVYFTAGFPSLNSTADIIEQLDLAGADVIEIGMPYSDPLADGQTIQESGSKALANGMTMDILFEQLKGIRAKSNTPLLLMGYLNQIMQYGAKGFCKKAEDCGIDGLIIPDLTIQSFENEYESLFSQHGLHTIFLITPRTPEDRIRKIDSLSKGFLYVVSDSSITGGNSDISQSQLDYFARIESMQLSNPLLIGFGIKDKLTFDTACQYASGAIIGSAYIRAIEEGIERTDGFISAILAEK